MPLTTVDPTPALIVVDLQAPEAHEAAGTITFPRMSQIASTADVLAAI